MSSASIAEEYVRLALAVDLHIPGYVDAYFGPAAWKDQAQTDGRRPVAELFRRATALAAAVSDSSALDSQRQDYLARQVRALLTSLRLLGGEKLALADEVEGLYDIRPAWIDEAVFEDAQQQLAELLPPGDTLLERMTAFKEQFIISVEQAREVLPLILEHLRDIARRRFPLPEHESIEVNFVHDRPWRAYNWYLGDCRSRIEINTDLPLRINELVVTMAHEVYPGHHTEACIKESLLVRDAGQVEHSITALNSPQCVVSEGIATSALSVAMSVEDQVAWFSGELLPRVGLHHLDASRDRRIAPLMDDLRGTGSNAAFLLHEKAAGADEVRRYMQRYDLQTGQEAGKMIEFLSNPLDRSYIFTYDAGRTLLKSLFAAKGNVTHWFTRLLTESVTPSQIRHWMLQ